MKRPPATPRVQAPVIRLSRRRLRRYVSERPTHFCVILPFVAAGKDVA